MQLCCTVVILASHELLDEPNVVILASHELLDEPKFDCSCHLIKALGEDKNYGPLHGVPNIREDLIGNKMEVLEFIFVKIRETL
jgi:hypothetical protein